MKKIVLISMTLVLVAALVIGGTLAYMTASTEKITNVFTVGNITITLTEAETEFKLIPGADIPKKPVVSVKKGSEPCYLYAYVENNLGDAATPDVYGFAWKVVGEDGGKTVYRYDTILDLSDFPVSSVDIDIFTQVSVSSDLEAEDLALLAGKTIVVQAYAHQSNHLTEAEADAEACAFFGLS